MEGQWNPESMIKADKILPVICQVILHIIKSVPNLPAQFIFMYKYVEVFANFAHSVLELILSEDLLEN